MERGDKENEVTYLTEQFGNCAVALCADYRGLTVSQITDLRQNLREKGSFGKVVKNTLAKLSVKKAYDGEGEDVDKFADVFNGPSFVVFSGEDPVSPAKVLADFAKSHEALEIKGGWFEGAFLDVNGVKNLSSMPSKEELYAKLLALLATPATKLVQTLNEPASQVVRVLGAHKGELSQGQS